MSDEDDGGIDSVMPGILLFMLLKLGIKPDGPPLVIDADDPLFDTIDQTAEYGPVFLTKGDGQIRVYLSTADKVKEIVEAEAEPSRIIRPH